MSASKKADTPKTKIKTLAPIKTSHSGAPNCCSGFFMKNTTKTCTEKFPGAQVGTAWKSSGSAQKPRMSGKATNQLNHVNYRKSALLGDLRDTIAHSSVSN